MRQKYLIPGVILVVIVLGLAVYLRLRPAPAAQQGDPAIALAGALVALGRDPEVALTPDQVKTMLPFLRVLRDTDPNDAEVSKALAEQIRNLLTPQQQAAIARMREEVQAGRAPGQFPRSGSGPRGPGGLGAPGSSFGAGGPQGGRAEFRRQVLTRLIERLQSQISQS